MDEKGGKGKNKGREGRRRGEEKRRHRRKTERREKECVSVQEMGMDEEKKKKSFKSIGRQEKTEVQGRIEKE